MAAAMVITFYYISLFMFADRSGVENRKCQKINSTIGCYKAGWFVFIVASFYELFNFHLRPSGSTVAIVAFLISFFLRYDKSPLDLGIYLRSLIAAGKAAVEIIHPAIAGMIIGL